MMVTLRTSGGSPALIDADFGEHLANLSGTLLTPDSPGYDEARTVWNAMIDRRPGLIVQCADANDVARAVRFARGHDLLVAVRGGGHNIAGNAVCDGGLMIDLSPMRSVRVDPAARTARVGAGATLGDVDRTTQGYGLATPLGVNSTTGIAGLTLGGGFGWLSRRLGLTIDHLLSAEVVTADGEIVRASAREHPDLFWALRGGGGNFGVVTAFEFQAHPVHTVYGGPMLWHLADAPAVLAWYRGFIATAPDTINGLFSFLQVPPAPPFPAELHQRNMCAILWCYTGALDGAPDVFNTLRRLIPPALDLTGPLPFPRLQGLFDELLPAGLQWYWRGDFVQTLSDAAIERHVALGATVPNIFSSMILFPLNGAAGRVPMPATAFGARDMTWSQVITGVDPDPAHAEQIKAWTIAYWEALHPYAAGDGAYVNFLMDEGQGRVRAAYRENYARLAAVKQQYDPENFFHVNQNIAPAVEKA